MTGQGGFLPRGAQGNPLSTPLKLLELLASLTPGELRYIAERDYQVDADLHLDALRSWIAQGGTLDESHYWYPYEVIELTAHYLEPGHEREFAACTLVVLAAVASGYDNRTLLEWKFEDRAWDYDRLQPVLRDAVLAAYVAAGI